jgi:ribosomal protein S21
MMSALEVRKKEKENVQSLVRRFTKAVQQSGILLRAREKMYKDRNISEEKKKRSALRRLELKAKYERLKKLGKI